MFTSQPQTQLQAPRSGIIQEYKDKMEGVKKPRNSDTLLDGDSNDNSFSKQITDSHTASMIGSNHNSVKSSPSITAELQNDQQHNITKEIVEDDYEHTTELSSNTEDSDYNSWFYGLYDSNMHNTYWDDIDAICPLLGDTLCQLKDRVGSILVCLGKVEIAKTNSTKKAEEFVDMIFDEIESVKSEKEIEELNKKYVPQFNIEHNNGMNLYDLYRMYHGDVPLLKAKSIIPYYPDDDSSEKQLLYRVLPEVMKKGVIDSLEKYFYGIFEPFAKVRINEIRETMKQKEELNRLDRILNDQELCGEQLLEL